MQINAILQAKRGLSTNLPTEAAIGEFLYTTDTKKLYMGNGVGNPLKEIGADVITHTQNTDTGTTNVSFTIDSAGLNPISLVNSGGVLELKTADGTALQSLKVKDLTVSGTTTTIESEIVKFNDNILELNSNVTSGEPSENAGLEVKRGAQPSAVIMFNEATDKWEIGIAGSEKVVVTTDDKRLGTKDIDETGLATGDIMVFDGTKWVRATGVSGGTF